MFDNMTRRRADTVSTCCNGPSLWRPRAVRQSLPAFQFECGYACGRKHSAGGDSGRGYFQATIWRDRATSHMLTIPRLWVGSDRLAEFAKSKQSEGYERPTQQKRRSNMAIFPKIETRRANRRNGAAYQHRRRRSLTGGHSVITHGRRMEYQRSHSMFLTHGIAGTARSSWSDRASLPRKRAGNAISRGCKKEKQGRDL
jgi:hypothetical protein